MQNMKKCFNALKNSIFTQNNVRYENMDVVFFPYSDNSCGVSFSIWNKENTLVTSIYYFYVDICTFYMCSILVNKAQMAFANKMHWQAVVDM